VSGVRSEGVGGIEVWSEYVEMSVEQRGCGQEVVLGEMEVEEVVEQEVVLGAMEVEEVGEQEVVLGAMEVMEECEWVAAMGEGKEVEECVGFEDEMKGPVQEREGVIGQEILSVEVTVREEIKEERGLRVKEGKLYLRACGRINRDAEWIKRMRDMKMEIKMEMEMELMEREMEMKRHQQHSFFLELSNNLHPIQMRGEHLADLLKVKLFCVGSNGGYGGV